MTLKKIFKPVDVNTELPEYPINIVLVDNRLPMLAQLYPDKVWHVDRKPIKNGITHWLKEEDLYTFNPTELETFVKNIIFYNDWKFYEDRGIDTTKRAKEIIDNIK
jgi:membrane carboxypeptidase/penicillin-binding protein PbpC